MGIHFLKAVAEWFDLFIARLTGQILMNQADTGPFSPSSNTLAL